MEKSLVGLFGIQPTLCGSESLIGLATLPTQVGHTRECLVHYVMEESQHREDQKAWTSDVLLSVDTSRLDGAAP